MGRATNPMEEPMSSTLSERDRVFAEAIALVMRAAGLPQYEANRWLHGLQLGNIDQAKEAMKAMGEALSQPKAG